MLYPVALAMVVVLLQFKSDSPLFIELPPGTMNGWSVRLPTHHLCEKAIDGRGVRLESETGVGLLSVVD